MSSFGNTNINGEWPPALARIDLCERVKAIRIALGFRDDANVSINFSGGVVSVSGRPGYHTEGDDGCRIANCIFDNCKATIVLPKETPLSTSPFADPEDEGA